jgi:hypothetical protein
MVKHTWSSLSLSQASGPSELREAVSSAAISPVTPLTQAAPVACRASPVRLLTREGVYVVDLGLEAHCGGRWTVGGMQPLRASNRVRVDAFGGHERGGARANPSIGITIDFVETHNT